MFVFRVSALRVWGWVSSLHRSFNFIWWSRRFDIDCIELLSFAVFRGCTRLFYFCRFFCILKHVYLCGSTIKGWNLDCLNILLLDQSTWRHYHIELSFNSTVEVERQRGCGRFFLLLILMLLRRSLFWDVFKENQILIEKRRIFPPISERTLGLQCLSVVLSRFQLCLWLKQLLFAADLLLLSQVEGPTEEEGVCGGLILCRDLPVQACVS